MIFSLNSGRSRRTVILGALVAVTLFASVAPATANVPETVVVTPPQSPGGAVAGLLAPSSQGPVRILLSPVNPSRLAGIISPELAGIISPELAGIISPELAGIISPELARFSPLLVSAMNPNTLVAFIRSLAERYEHSLGH